MKELRTEIEIAASANRVWATLTDFSSFPVWNPFIRRVDGELRVGASLVIGLQLPTARSMTFRPRVLRVEPGRQLRWRGHFIVRGLFDGEHAFEIEALSADRARLVHREIFTGLLVPLMARSLDHTTRRRSEEHTSELQSRLHLVCRLLLEKKKKKTQPHKSVCS